MKKISTLLFPLLLLGLISCQQPTSTNEIATAVKDKLTTQGPTWSGSTWTNTKADSGDTFIDEITTVFNATAPTATQKVIPLTSKTQSLTVNANNTFTATITITADATNFGKTFLPDNYYWSTSSSSLSPPPLVTTGTYKNYVQNFTWYSPYFFVNGISSGLWINNLPAGSYTIGTTGSTTYNGSTLYPVTYVTSNAAGKNLSLTTYTGTWKAVAPQNPTYSGQTLVLTVTAGTAVAYTYTSTGAVATTTTTTLALPPGPQMLTAYPGINPDTGTSGFYFYSNLLNPNGSNSIYQQ